MGWGVKFPEHRLLGQIQVSIPDGTGEVLIPCLHLRFYMGTEGTLPSGRGLGLAFYQIASDMGTCLS